MELDIKTPSYYEQHYHIDEEIICMCNHITEYIEDKDFSEIIKMVDVIPVVAPKENLEQGLWREDILFTIYRKD